MALSLLACPATGQAEEAGQSLCLMLEAAAKTSDLPPAFLARVIWRESRFDANAIGPFTRSGQRAQGIAQFMPGTASERGVDDPFDPVQALPKAAAFLSDLRTEFGNLGLAAAAYNAGPARVRGWLNGTRTMPTETRNYVWAITGRSVDEWAKAGTVDLLAPAIDCEQLIASLQQPPGAFFYELKQQVESALSKPWGLVLAAGLSRDRVLEQYSRVIGKVRALTGAPEPILTAARERGLNRVYKAWVGADTRSAANALCARIRTAGGACFVLRAPRSGRT
ncbi:lytic transglycosylase domain-containing protein [Microbacteriaceae bacterium K1510]|nr:lytic transglycosylase domain-containing protein [Microbacteriaceae bacterium K1510]